MILSVSKNPVFGSENLNNDNMCLQVQILELIKIRSWKTDNVNQPCFCLYSVTTMAITTDKNI